MTLEGVTLRVGLGTMLTGRSDGGNDTGRTVSFGTLAGGSLVGGATAATCWACFGGVPDVTGSVCFDGGVVAGAARAIGLGMMNAGLLLGGTSTALR